MLLPSDFIVKGSGLRLTLAWLDAVGRRQLMSLKGCETNVVDKRDKLFFWHGLRGWHGFFVERPLMVWREAETAPPLGLHAKAGFRRL